MSASHFLSKSALKTSLWTGAIAGGLVAVSMLFSGGPSRDLQQMQLNEFSDAAPFVTEPATETDTTTKIVLALASGAVLGLGLNAASQRQSGKFSAVRPIAGRTATQFQKVGDFHRANRSLRRKLLLLLHEDQQAAERLVQQATFKYPGKSADWYLEKVIYDLQRDRGVAG